jgi:hypothetical protein
MPGAVIRGESRIYGLIGEGEYVFGMTIGDSKVNVAEYVRRLPFESPTVFCQSDSDMYVIGSIPRIGQRALFHVHVAHGLVGALESPESLKIDSVLAFDEAKEEPLCVGLWSVRLGNEHADGVVAVGTCGRGNRGRLILFERQSMTPICKTSIPSKQVTVVEEISPDILAIGCMDCIVLVGLVQDDSSDGFDLVTQAVFQTYVQVKHINKVDDKRFLVVLENGQITLCGIKGDEVIVIAQPEIHRHVISACVLIPPKNESFISSTIDGDHVVYSIDGSSESGLMRIERAHHDGTSLTAFTKSCDSAILGFSNGSIIQVSESNVN